MIRVKPVYCILIGVLLAGFFLSQTINRMMYGNCMFRYVLPRCDYASYVRASNEILRGETPYYQDTCYIYSPLLAIIIIPLALFSEIAGFWIWTVMSIIAFGYGAFRAGRL